MNMIRNTALLLLMIGCTSTGENEKTLWVASRLAECTGEGPMRCMMIRESPEEDWQFFYSQIEGFSYEEGFEYQIRVRLEDIANPPAGGSSIRYSLLEIISQEAKEASPGRTTARQDLFSHPWRLKTYIQNGEVVTLPVEHEVLLEIQEDGTISGKSACNNYTGKATLNANSFSTGALASTRKMCADEDLMKLEATYLALLENVISVSPDRSRYLTLVCADGSELKFLPKPEDSQK